MMLRLIAVFCVLVLTACGGSDKPSATPSESPTQTATSSAPDPQQALKDAVTAYSNAFLTGDGATAYALLSKRCQDATPLSDFAAFAEQAESTYGELGIKTLDVRVDGDKGSATYTYPVATLNQTDETWIDEGGWKYDAC